jgi:hypothetical protein
VCWHQLLGKSNSEISGKSIAMGAAFGFLGGTYAGSNANNTVFGLRYFNWGQNGTTKSASEYGDYRQQRSADGGN